MYPTLSASFLNACRKANAACEESLVEELLHQPPYPSQQAQQIQHTAANLVEQLRQQPNPGGLVGAFLGEYGLTDAEGVALMCLAESVLRIPDAKTREQLIADKIGSANWDAHLGQAQSLWVNASTWALLLTSKVARLDEPMPEEPRQWLSDLSQRLSMPVVQQAVCAAIRVLGSEFVFSENIEQAVRGAAGKSYSFDMLGEGARDEASSARYFAAYRHAIKTVAEHGALDASVSIKLSALHPRVEFSQRRRLRSELLPRLKDLCALAQIHGVAVTIDAEESWRLLPTLELFEALLAEASLQQLTIGIVVQAYSKRALTVLRWLNSVAQRHKRQIPVRLVKGAYWDTEIKHTQEQGLGAYPVFTNKAHTDLNYLACAGYILAQPQLFGQFATHNAHTLVAIHTMAGRRRDFEFQRLHGMGEDVFDVAGQMLDLPAVRVYAPIGEYKDLLAYLIRRLLENGANSSFVHKLYDCSVATQALISDPCLKVGGSTQRGVHAAIPLPQQLFGQRKNSAGLDLDEPEAVGFLYQAMRAWRRGDYAVEQAALGLDTAFERAQQAFAAWSSVPVHARGECLERLANLLQEHQHHLVAVLSGEAGKTLQDAVAEVREAVDFCRYYAHSAEGLLAPRVQQGVTGELNQLSLHGRGVWVCISPWNFPLAIFVGQCAAALVTGNTVVAKPSEFTPQVSRYVDKLVAEAGFPDGVFNLVVGDAQLGRRLIEHPGTAGVAFTGSTHTARQINRALAAREGPIVPLIAETGGQNVMFVDSTALLEAVADDVVRSAFTSAGQRCSALRLLYLQQDIAPQALKLISGAMDQLQIGRPGYARTDVGPVIHPDAARRLNSYINNAAEPGRLLHQCALPDGLSGQYVAPAIIEVEGIHNLAEEQFGPVLHVATFASSEFATTMDAVNAAGFGLTMGLHTRLQHRMDYTARHARVGNVYINRDMVGAVVESQPFGGQGLSGTGPKAGGPFYLQRFVTERVVTTNTVAGGGNRELLNLQEAG